MEDDKLKKDMLSAIIIESEEEEELGDVLDNLITDTLSEFVVLMRVEALSDIPDKYSFIPKNVFKSRFRRLGKEGIENYSQSEQSFTYDMSDFKEYSDIIIDYIDSKIETTGVGHQWL